jgi:hypothetical protein
LADVTPGTAAVADDRDPVGTRVDHLRADEPLLQPVEALRVDGHVAVEERVLELVGRGLDLQAGLDRPLVVQVAAGLDDEAVHVRVAAEDHEGLRRLHDGARALDVGLVHRSEGDTRQGGLLVVRVRVALDRQQGDPVENRGLLDERLEDAALQVVLREGRSLRESDCHVNGPSV